MADLKPTVKINDVKHSTAEHQRKTGHMIAWDYPEIVATTKWKSQLDTYESLAINHYKAAPPNGLNKDNGPYISNSWKPLCGTACEVYMIIICCRRDRVYFSTTVPFLTMY